MNICERLVVMSETELIDVADLPAQIVGSTQPGMPEELEWPDSISLQEALATVERNLLARARDRYRNQAGIAAALGVNQSTIARKLKRYNLT
jgi:transcriptional regulator with PAS, ATPase and Fis domain